MVLVLNGTFLQQKNFRSLAVLLPGPGQRSRYSDSVRAGRSGDRIPVEARFSATVQTSPEAHPASYTMGTGSFPRAKWPGRDHPPPSTAVVKERVQLHLYSPFGPSWPLQGRTLSLCTMYSCECFLSLVRTDIETSTNSLCTLPNNKRVCLVVKSQHVAGVLSHH
jgi:hypothetical protein